MPHDSSHAQEPKWKRVKVNVGAAIFKVGDALMSERQLCGFCLKGAYYWMKH